jgi:hypothetical protein
VAHGDRLADIRYRGWGHSLLSEIPEDSVRRGTRNAPDSRMKLQPPEVKASSRR